MKDIYSSPESEVELENPNADNFANQAILNPWISSSGDSLLNSMPAFGCSPTSQKPAKLHRNNTETNTTKNK